MKNCIIALSLSAWTFVGGGVLSYAQGGPPPVKVTGGGILQEGAYDENGMFVYGMTFHQFSVTINPDQPPGRKSPQANIQVAGPLVEEFWGCPLKIRDDFQGCLVLDWFGPDSKPGQAFRFLMQHPSLGEVAVWIYEHDNQTPGLNRTNPSWSDWVMVWVEPVDGDWRPGPNQNGEMDDLFFLAGIVVKGNVVDHRSGYSY